MKQQLFDTCGTSFLFESERDEAFQNQSILWHYDIADPNTHPVAKLGYRDRPQARIIWDGQAELILEADWKEIRNTEVLKTLLHLISHYALQKDKKFVIHASSISLDGKAKLIYGSSGSGKTITALTSCFKHSARLISNGSSVVKIINDQPVVVGTHKKGLKLRQSSIKQAMPELADDLFSVDYDKSQFDRKRYVSPEDLGLMSEQNFCPLDRFYKIKLQPGSMHHNALEPYRTRLMLYEDISRLIRGSASLLMFGEHADRTIRVPDLDNQNIYSDRTKLIESIVSGHLGDALYGSPDQCAAYLAEKQQEVEYR
ncbi:hypothetical protein [Paenibacillus tyrfis]|uniref:hypothetical protein n=1 Tax=Paenibacillus tyrfis TaxID=1501230 RepID=UPI00209CB2F5|nr:hypothetical protein [Paenibacillus tyrfis]MCP1311568.1 hypothetical protein [Paenibacillus tyrfis]